MDHAADRSAVITTAIPAVLIERKGKGFEVVGGRPHERGPFMLAASHLLLYSGQVFQVRQKNAPA